MNAPYVPPSTLSAQDIDLAPVMAKALTSVVDLSRALQADSPEREATCKAPIIYEIFQFKRLPKLLDFFTFSLAKIDPEYEVAKFEADSILRLALAAELKDMTTGTHIVRMSLFSAFLARELGLSRPECRNILFAALAHDVGKIAIPDNILLKPGKLTTLEFEEMQQHSIYGSFLLEESDMLDGSNVTLMRMARDIALFHHENYDGTGYPINGLGENIPLAARIVRICDSYDAITSDRPYKKRLTPAHALKIIKQDSGRAYDPRIVACFAKSFDRLAEVQSEIETFGS